MQHTHPFIERSDCILVLLKKKKEKKISFVNEICILNVFSSKVYCMFQLCRCFEYLILSVGTCAHRCFFFTHILSFESKSIYIFTCLFFYLPPPSSLSVFLHSLKERCQQINEKRMNALDVYCNENPFIITFFFPFLLISDIHPTRTIWMCVCTMKKEEKCYQMNL